MPFFQNPFNQDFEGNWLLGDRQHMPKFVLKGHTGRGNEFFTSVEGPFDLSGNDADSNPKNILNISFNLQNTTFWTDMSVTISAVDLSATTAVEIVGSINNDATLSEYFKANVNGKKVELKQINPAINMKSYVKNGQAEESLLFNKLAGVAELPDYFERHTIANKGNFDDSVGMLIALDASGGSSVDEAVIDNAGLDHNVLQENHELLGGKSGLFIFTKQTVSGGNIVEKIEYHAGAKAGDLAKKTEYADFSGAIAQEVKETPYVLTSSDLI